MKKLIVVFMMLTICIGGVFADPDDELFGGVDETFAGFGGDDDFFFDDDGIEELTDVSAKSDLSKGVIFQNGSVKIGGNFSTGLSTTTTLYADDGKNFGDYIKETRISPNLSAFLSVDARPTEILRMYTKFGFAYPFKSNAFSTAQTSLFTNPITKKDIFTTKVETTVTDYLKLKEIFTDFSLFDRAFFRFGIHTVTWGAGYFFSPVSDIINTSMINPENPTEQVEGSLNLRTQIIFPGTQNCLWFYVIPSTDFISNTTADSYLRDTALAAKGDILIKDYEFGVGAFWRYQHAPKGMLTTTGAIKKVSVFGEFVYQYGADSEWQKNKEWDDKTSIFQATAGLSYYWKNPMITLATQYYYDSNDKDLTHQYLTYGHNIAAIASFGKIFGNKNFSASIFAMANFGKKDLTDTMKAMLAANGINANSFINACTISTILNFTGLPNVTLGTGPYITWSDFDEKPVVSLKLTATLGGGRF